MKVSTIIIPARQIQISADTRKFMPLRTPGSKLKFTAGALVLGTVMMAYYVNTMQDIKQRDDAQQSQQTAIQQNHAVVEAQPIKAPVVVAVAPQPVQQVVEITTTSTSTLQSALTDWVKQNRKKGIKLSDNLTKQMVTIIFQKCVERNIDPFLFLALVKVESEFDIMAQSPVGAKGLSQIMPQVHKEKLVGVNVYDPEINLDRGIKILAEYKGWHKGNINDALLQYNGSLKHNKPTYARQVFAERDKLVTFVQTRIAQSMSMNSKAVKVSITIDPVVGD